MMLKDSEIRDIVGSTWRQTCVSAGMDKEAVFGRTLKFLGGGMSDIGKGLSAIKGGMKKGWQGATDAAATAKETAKATSAEVAKTPGHFSSAWTGGWDAAKEAVGKAGPGQLGRAATALGAGALGTGAAAYGVKSLAFPEKPKSFFG